MAAFIVDTVHEYEINFICIKLLLFQIDVTEGKNGSSVEPFGFTKSCWWNLYLNLTTAYKYLRKYFKSKGDW